MSALARLRRLVPAPARRLAARRLVTVRGARIEQALAGLAAGSRPVVAGPWLGEVGFELLYWVPFLAWFADAFDVAPGRLVAISRGGAGDWYRPVAGRYVDVFDHLPVEEVRAEHDRRVRDLGEQKQTRFSGFDRRCVDLAVRACHLPDWGLLHPSVMHALFNPYWWGHMDTGWVHARTRYRRLAPAPEAPAEPYVAAKFYFNDCFPPTEANRTFVRDMLGRLAARGPVVSLTTQFDLDDHAGADAGAPGIRCLPAGLAPGRNLEAQDRMVAGARAFVGTYGGFSYLSPLHGVPSVGCYSEPDGYSVRHLAMARSAFASLGLGDPLDVRPAGDGAAAVADRVATLAWGQEKMEAGAHGRS